MSAQETYCAITGNSTQFNNDTEFWPSKALMFKKDALETFQGSCLIKLNFVTEIP